MRRYYFGAHKFNCVLGRFNMSADLPSQETGVALACLTVVRLLSSAIVAVFICLSCVSVRLAYMKLIGIDSLEIEGFSVLASHTASDNRGPRLIGRVLKTDTWW